MNTDTIAQELNRLYEFEVDKYIAECDHWKRMGYKIFRNSEGKHKVVEPPQPKYVEGKPVDLNTAFGGIFGEIFNGT